MKPGFWNEPVRIWLKACGRQDLIDRGDAFAQRVTALLVAVKERVDQYLSDGDVYNGRGGTSNLPLASTNPGQALSEIESFVNVRLRQEMGALENVLSVFDDLKNRQAGEQTAFDVRDQLAPIFKGDPNVVGVEVVREADSHCIMALTLNDPGTGVPSHVGSMSVQGYPFMVRRAPRSLRRAAYCKVP